MRLLQFSILYIILPIIAQGQPGTTLVEDEWGDVFVPRILGLEFVDDQAIAVSQGGQLYRIDLTETPYTELEFLDLTDQVGNTNGERGLLGFAFHPDFPNTPTFYLNYTRGNPLETVVSEWEVDPSTWIVDEDSERVLITYEQPFDNHNGGHIAFGPDGYLYISSGDGGSAGDPLNNAQNKNSLLGKILRIDVDFTDSGLEYGIPADNPLVDTNGRDEVYAWGVRNPWRFSFDRQSGELWAADVGQDAWEYIHVIQNGKNYGWRILEGSHCFNPSTGCDSTGLELPVFEYNHSQGDRSITGGFIYRGQKQPLLHRKYIYADFVSGRIWALEVTPDALQVVSNEELMNTNINVSSFAEDLDGEIYVLTYGSGGVRRLIVEPPAPRWISVADTVNSTDEISWTAGRAEVDQYALEVSRDSLFTDLVFSTALSDTFFQPGLEVADLEAGRYYSRVRAENRAGMGEISELLSWYFADGATSLHPTYTPEDVVLYPNPTSDVVHVEWPTDFVVKKYIVHDAQGMSVQKGFANTRSAQIQLDVSSLSTGSYALGLMGNNGEELWRVFLVQ